MNQDNRNSVDNRQKIFNLTLAAMAGQVGCLTLIIIFGALFGGLWLDNRMGTRPTFTLIFVIGSIPISLVAMFAVVRVAVKRIKSSAQGIETQKQKEETGFGKD